MNDVINERTSLLRSATNSCEVHNDPRAVPCARILVKRDGGHPLQERVTTGLGRFFLAEIALTLYFLSDYPLTLIMQKYIVEWTTGEFIKHDALLNITHNLNNTISPCAANISFGDYEFQQSIQSRASMISALQGATRGIPAIFTNLIIGAASDRYGRFWAILPPSIGMLLFSIAVFVVTTYSLPVWYVFIAEFCFGLSGSTYGMIMGCTAYIADFTAQERLSIRFGILYFCALVPTIISAEAVGPLVVAIGLSKSSLIAVIVLAVNILYVAIFLRESQRNEVVHAGAEQGTGLLGTIWNQIDSTVSVIRGDGPLGNYRSARFILLFIAILFSTIGSADTSVNTLFAMNYPLCWELKTIGLYTGILVATFAVGSIALMPLQKICMSDNLIAIMATTAALMASIYKFFVTSTLMMFFVPVFGFFIMQVYPCNRSMVSALAGKNRQGAVFGMVSVIEVICSVLGTVSLNTIYSSTLYIATSFVYLFVALIYFMTLILLSAHYIILRKETKAAAQLGSELNDDEQQKLVV